MSDIAGFQASAERASQVVHLDFGLLDALVVVSASRRVEHGRHARVVIAVTGSDTFAASPDSPSFSSA